MPATHRPARVQPSPSPPPRRKRSNKEEREFASIENSIQLQEGRREILAAKVLNPDEMKDSFRAKAISDELNGLDSSIEALYVRWQILSDLAPM